MVIRLIKLFLVVCWMSLIFLFSNDSGVQSTNKSDGLIIKVVETVLKRNLSDEEKEKWTSYLVVPVRKAAHLFIYLILGILIFNFIRDFNFSLCSSIFLSIVTSFFYACSDEIHQLFVMGRSGQISDVVIDTIGASIGIILMSKIVRKCSKYEQEKRVS